MNIVSYGRSSSSISSLSTDIPVQMDSKFNESTVSADQDNFDDFSTIPPEHFMKKTIYVSDIIFAPSLKKIKTIAIEKIKDSKKHCQRNIAKEKQPLGTSKTTSEQFSHTEKDAPPRNFHGKKNHHIPRSTNKRKKILMNLPEQLVRSTW